MQRFWALLGWMHVVLIRKQINKWESHAAGQSHLPIVGCRRTNCVKQWVNIWVIYSIVWQTGRQAGSQTNTGSATFDVTWSGLHSKNTNNKPFNEEVTVNKRLSGHLKLPKCSHLSSRVRYEVLMFYLNDLHKFTQQLLYHYSWCVVWSY